MSEVKIGDINQNDIKGTLSISEYIKGQMAQIAIKGLWILVGAVLAFLITQFFGLSTIVHELNGKQESIDKTVELILQERNDSFSTLLILQKQITEDNQNLRNQLNHQSK